MKLKTKMKKMEKNWILFDTSDIQIANLPGTTKKVKLLAHVAEFGCPTCTWNTLQQYNFFCHITYFHYCHKVRLEPMTWNYFLSISNIISVTKLLYSLIISTRTNFFVIKTYFLICIFWNKAVIFPNSQPKNQLFCYHS